MRASGFEAARGKVFRFWEANRSGFERISKVLVTIPLEAKPTIYSRVFAAWRRSLSFARMFKYPACYTQATGVPLARWLERLSGVKELVGPNPVHVSNFSVVLSPLPINQFMIVLKIFSEVGCLSCLGVGVSSEPSVLSHATSHIPTSTERKREIKGQALVFTSCTSPKTRACCSNE